MKPRLTTKGLLATLITSLLIVCGSVAYMMWAKIRPLEFDSSQWKRESYKAFSSRPASEITAATRDRMVGDLFRRFPLMGKSRVEVVKLLGEPDLSKSAPFTEWDMIYWLGPDDRIAGMMDLKWLVIKLDTAGMVVRCQITFD